MDNIYNKNQKLILNIIYTSLVFTLVYILALGIGLKLNIIMQILGVFLGSIVVKFFLFNPLVLYILLIFAFLVLVSVNHFITPVLFSLGERIIYLFANIFNNLQGKENISSDNLILFWGIIIVLVSLFTAFILFKDKSIYFLLPVYIGSFIYYWYIFFDEAYWMISTFLLLFFILMGLKKYSEGNPEVEYSPNYNFEGLYIPWIKTSVIYGILIVFIALSLPKSHKYIHWPWLQQKVYSVFPGMADLRSYDGYNRDSGKTSLFDFSISAYQNEDTGRLGGPISLSDTKIMTVRADSSNYLRGNVKHIYSGDSWRTVTFPSEKSKLRKDFSKISKRDRETYYNQTSITITNHSFASTTIFSPYKPSSVYFNGDYFLEASRDDILFFSNGIYSGESYTVKVQNPLPYGVLVSLGAYNRIENITDLEVYLQTPEDKITDRTKTLVQEIVIDANNDFEKAVAIENYLRNNYEYNLNVNEVPEDKEFIDYFLFEEQEGYCTYYATAIAIMLRLEGIPTRYVEGYLAKDLVDPGIYEVSHKDAHAWVEAFIEPVGWMSFEPTPIYPIESRLENYQPDTQVENTHPNDTNENNTDYKENINREIIYEEEGRIVDERDSNFEEFYDRMPVNLPENTSNIFIIILSAIIFIRIIIGLLIYIYKDFQGKRLSSNKRIIYLYQQILRIIEFLGYPQEYGETHYEYANRIAYKFYTHDDIGIKEITDIFVRAKYSNSPASDEDISALEIHKKILEKRLKNYWNPIVYYYRKYINIG